MGIDSDWGDVTFYGRNLMYYTNKLNPKEDIIWISGDFLLDLSCIFNINRDEDMVLLISEFLKLKTSYKFNRDYFSLIAITYSLCFTFKK